MRPNKQQPKYITTRPKWKEIVTKSHEGFDKWLYGHSCISYYDGVYDAIVAAMLVLHDDHHFGTKRLAVLVDRVYDIVGSINTKDLITANEIIEGLRQEGVDIAVEDKTLKGAKK